MVSLKVHALILFTVYASKLFQDIRAHLPDVHAHADDTQLYLLFQPNSEVDQQEAVQATERCFTNIGAWMELDKLKLNSDKTEIILVGTRPQLDKIRFDHLKVDDIEVPTMATTSVRNLRALVILGSQHPFNYNFFFFMQRSSFLEKRANKVVVAVLVVR